MSDTIAQVPLAPAPEWSDTRKTGMIQHMTHSMETFGPPWWRRSTFGRFLAESVLPLVISVALFVLMIKAVWSALEHSGLASDDLYQTGWSWVLLALIGFVFLNFISGGSRGAGRLVSSLTRRVVRMVIRIPFQIFRWLDRGINQAITSGLRGGANRPPIPVYQFELVQHAGADLRSFTGMMQQGRAPAADRQVALARVRGALRSVALRDGDVVTLEGHTDRDGVFQVRGGFKYAVSDGQLRGGARIVIDPPGRGAGFR